MSLRKVKGNKATSQITSLAFIAILLLPIQQLPGIANQEKSKLKVKINYIDSPNWSGFYEGKDLKGFLDISKRERLEGKWSGKFTLSKDSIYWINPKENSNKILRSIYGGPYDVTFDFTFNDKDVLKNLKIIQDSVNYSSIKIELLNEKQINY